MKLATTTSDFMCFGLNGEESVGAVADAGFKYIDYASAMILRQDRAARKRVAELRRKAACFGGRTRT